MTTKKDIFIYIIIALSIFLITFVVATTNPISPDIKNNYKPIKQLTMNIYTPTWTVNYTSINTINITVSDLLFEWAEEANITIERDFFSGYESYLITGINGSVNGENELYWQFYVNGEYSTLGSSNFYLKNNDVVEWRFETSPW